MRYTKIIKRYLAFLLALAMVAGAMLQNPVVSKAAAASSTTSTTKRISVHDPSVYYDSAKNKYYIFGSHLAQAGSTDLRSWNGLGTQGYSNKTLYVSENVEGIYYVKNKFSNLYLDVADGNSADGANIQQWSYNGADAQKFKFVSTGDGYYYILTGASGYTKCVDVANVSAEDGANINQWEYWGGDGQKFRVVKQPDGTYAILSKVSNCASGLDVYEWSTESGGNINQWNYWGGDCQKWILEEAVSNSGSTQASTSEPLENALASSFLWAGYNDTDCSGGYAVWAPDVIYNKDYVWNDGSKGAYMLYYSTSSTYIRSCIGYAVSKSVEGPYSYVDTIVYSGFTKGDNNVTTTSSLGTKTVNTNYNNTNIPRLISEGRLSSVRDDWFNSNGSFNNSLCPNAIDPTVLYDADGKMWMTYGSWSGGIYILELDPATGQAKYPKSNSGLTDGYFGKRIAGGYTLSGEGPYIVYDKETGYYYLYLTYGWLGVDGGYHMRLYRSKTINGTYKDAAGNSATYSSASDKQASKGIKLMGNYDFSTLATDGYKSCGHNSAFIDTDGSRYLVYHTRFNGGTEYHEVRVHQQFMNADGWPVTAVYEFLGSKISDSGYSMNDMAGTYEFVNHGTDVATSNVGMLETESVTLKSDGSITGDYKGTWSYTNGTYYCQMEIDSVTYKGVFFKQKDESSSHKEVMTFSLIGENNECLWGTKTVASTEPTTTQAATQATTAAQATTQATTQAPVSGNSVTHNFATDGNTNPLFTITGNTSTSKGSVTYNGITSGTCLKMESSTSISFTAPSKGTLTLVFGGSTSASGKSVKVDGSSKTIGSNQILTVDVSAGSHTITKDDSINLFFIVYTPEGGSSESHTHSYTAKITTAAGCETAGVKTYTCSCGASYTEAIAATGHSYTGAVTKEATCTTAGVKTYTCTCGSSYTEAIAATGHSYSSSWTVDVAATTTSEGSKSRHCTVCSSKTDVTVIPKLDSNTTNGLVYDSAAGKYYYYVNGSVASNYTGFVDNAGYKWYVVAGAVDTSFTGLGKENDVWYCVRGGKVDLTYTGLILNGGYWWYVDNGMLNTSYTGPVENAGTTWYVMNGKIDTSYVGIRNDGTSYWYIANGKVNTSFVGLYNFAGAWWYINEGKIQTDYKGMIDYSGYTWYVANGKVDTSFTGLGLHNGVWYCVQGGKVNMSYTGLVKNGGEWWYITNGVLDTDVTGVVETGGSKWVVATGKLQSGYNGTYEKDGITYTVENGKVVSSATSQVSITTAQQLAEDMQIGWNLGNTFDANDCTWLDNGLDYESAWNGVKTTKAHIDKLKDAGFNAVRIPVSWHNHVSGANHTIDSAWIARVKEVVDYCIDNDMYVILNIHHDNSNSYIMPRQQYLEQSKKYLVDIWTQLAEYFKSYDHHLVFESMNEPRLIGSNYEWWLDMNSNECIEAVQCINTLNQLFVDTVRASGGNNATRFLTVPGYAASSQGALNNYFVVPTDTIANHLMITVHAYTPYNFALQGASESGSVSSFDPNSSSSTGEIDTMLSDLYNKFVSKGQTLIIDEFGARNKNENTSAREAYAKYYVEKARSYGITCFWWDNNAFDTYAGEAFGLLDRSTNQWRYEGIVDALVEGSKVD